MGLRRLHESIRVGFDNNLQPVPRAAFRSRIAGLNRPDFIPLNFFLFNYIENGEDFVAVDELVFQALTAEHSDRFDQLALFAFNFSYAGRWTGMAGGQRYPALWARNYIVERVAGIYQWDTSQVSADDIEKYLRSQPNFKAETYRKVSTNLAYLYRVGGLNRFSALRIERWWVDCLFLALDRIVGDRWSEQMRTNANALPSLLLNSNFTELTGPPSSEKTFAMAHLLSLYLICGEMRRFNPDVVQDRIAVELPDYYWQQPNDNAPQGAVHPTNPRIFKTIPRDCAPLAEKAGFRIVYHDDIADFDPKEYIERQVREAVDSLQRDGIKPTMTAEELHKLTRGT